MVMVLSGGPDRERDVSLNSGNEVAKALREAGHKVVQRDILPNNLSALDEFASLGCQVIFPVMHGSWGEGGPLQELLDARGVPYVGCRAPAAALCMDKHRTKAALVQAGLPTPAFELLTAAKRRTIRPPLVFKPLREGSSIDLAICEDAEQARRARHRLSTRYPELLAEQYIRGRELTVGVIADPTVEGGVRALPPIQIVPAVEFYDYDAKYDRNDTQYLFDIDLPEEVLSQIAMICIEAFTTLGCRHLARVDLMVDRQDQPWILEVNTIPGFTTHSLLPKAANHAGMPMPVFVDYLVRMAAGNV
jgi:D-alanine-D-alanine ligase